MEKTYSVKVDQNEMPIQDEIMKACLLETLCNLNIISGGLFVGKGGWLFRIKYGEQQS